MIISKLNKIKIEFKMCNIQSQNSDNNNETTD